MGRSSDTWLALVLLPGLPVLRIDTHPVVLPILDCAIIAQSVCEKLTQIIVIRGLFETKISAVFKIFGKFRREAFAQLFNGRLLFAVANLLVFLLVRSSTQSLPGKTAFEEVDEDMAQSFKIVTARLLAAHMCIDAHVTSSARECLALTIRDVLLGFGVAILLGHAKVNNVDDIGGLGARATNEEVIRLNVAVDMVLLVDGLDTRDLGRCK